MCSTRLRGHTGRCVKLLPNVRMLFLGPVRMATHAHMCLVIHTYAGPSHRAKHGWISVPLSRSHPHTAGWFQTCEGWTMTRVRMSCFRPSPALSLQALWLPPTLDGRDSQSRVLWHQGAHNRAVTVTRCVSVWPGNEIPSLGSIVIVIPKNNHRLGVVSIAVSASFPLLQCGLMLAPAGGAGRELCYCIAGTC